MKITKIDTAVPKTQKLKVAAYCRVSTDNDDQLESLEIQREHYEDYIHRNTEWEYAGVFYDEGISATSMNSRTGLNTLLDECRSGKINHVLTKSISRFARNTVDCISTVRELLDIGVSMYFERENINTGSMESELILSILSSLAEEESHSTSENIKWSVRKAFLEGTYRQSYAPYGYYIGNDRSLQIEPNEAAVVERIFNMIISGTSAYRTALILNSENIPAKRGGKWDNVQICEMIRNERYVGDCLLQKTYTDERFKRHHNKGEEQMYLVQDSHEPVVSREIFDKANRMLEIYASFRNVESGTDKYLNRHTFSGKIVCGECGSTLKRAIINTTVAWSCKKHISDNSSCAMKSVKDEALKAAFATMINKLIFSRKIILEPYVRKLRNNSRDDVILKIAELSTRIKEIPVEKEKLRILWSGELIDSIFYTQEINRLNKAVSEYKKEIRELENTKTIESVTFAEAEKLLKYIETAEISEHFDSDAFTAFVSQITMHDRTHAGFVLKCGLEFKEKLR